MIDEREGVFEEQVQYVKENVAGMARLGRPVDMDNPEEVMAAAYQLGRLDMALHIQQTNQRIDEQIAALERHRLGMDCSEWHRENR